jgi:hypothetical protein
VLPSCQLAWGSHSSLSRPTSFRKEPITALTWIDESYPLIEINTADTLTPERRRRGPEPNQ